MTPISQDLPAFYYDLQSLAPLKQAAEENPKDIETLRNVAQQFESMFMQMVLKSMRTASPGDSLFDNKQSLFYRDMFDQQLSVELAGSGGMGLADVLVEQLTRSSIHSSVDPFAANRLAVDHGLPIAQHRVDLQAPIPQAAATQAAAAQVVPAELPRPLNLEAPPPPQPQPQPQPTGSVAMSETGDLSPTADQSAQPQTLATADKGRWDSPAEFVRDIWPHAVDAAQQLGVDPKVLVAQSALETGWGSKLPHSADGRSSFNLFGIKAGGDWSGERAVVGTLEYEGDRFVAEKSAFRMYDSVADSMSDYVDFLKGRARYADVLKNVADPEKYSHALQRAGYATDPVYADKILRVMQSKPLAEGLSGLVNASGKSAG